MLQVREMRLHCAIGLVVLRIRASSDGALVAKNALCWQQCFFTHSTNQGWANLFNGRAICRKPKVPASRKTSL